MSQGTGNDDTLLPTHYAMLLVIPSGLTRKEQKQRITAALFAMSGVAQAAGVTVEWGPRLKNVIETHLVGG